MGLCADRRQPVRVIDAERYAVADRGYRQQAAGNSLGEVNAGNGLAAVARDEGSQAGHCRVPSDCWRPVQIAVGIDAVGFQAIQKAR